MLLLFLPSLAVWKLTQWVDFRIILALFAAISLTTFQAYRHDKQAAEAGARRTPEATLHGLELFGGWPIAFLSQRFFRHKTSKLRYQITFWLIVAIHQAAAFGFLQEWRLSRDMLRFLNDKGVDRPQQSDLPIVTPGPVTNDRVR